MKPWTDGTLFGKNTPTYSVLYDLFRTKNPPPILSYARTETLSQKISHSQKVLTTRHKSLPKAFKTTSSSFSRQNQPTREAQLLLVQHVVYYSRMLSFLHWDEMGRFTRASVLTHFETCVALYYCGRKLKCKAKLKWYLRAFLVVFLN